MAEIEDLRELLQAKIEELEMLQVRIDKAVKYLTLMQENSETPKATKDIVDMIMSYLVD